MTRITFLGTGTSHGVPMIGCSCAVCKSADVHDKRFRSSVLIEKDNTSVIIDTGYEFRLQCIRANVTHLEGVLYTHAHSDHLMGLDDLRVFTRKKRLPVYSFKSVLDEIEGKFPYAFKDIPNMGLPQLEPVAVNEYREFSVGKLSIVPIPVMHGTIRIAGYRIGTVAYITDVSDILLEKNAQYLDKLEYLIIGALRERPHATHYSYSEAADIAIQLGARNVYFTHMNHEHSHKEVEMRYHEIAKPAYDGLVLEVSN